MRINKLVSIMGLYVAIAAGDKDGPDRQNTSTISPESKSSESKTGFHAPNNDLSIIKYWSQLGSEDFCGLTEDGVPDSSEMQGYFHIYAARHLAPQLNSAKKG